MNPRLFLCSALLPLLLQACDKAEEKPAPKVITGPPPPAASKRAPVVPEGTAGEGPAVPAPPAPAVTPPTQEELDSFFTSVDAFLKEAAPVVQAGTPIPDEVRNPLRMKVLELTKAQGTLLRAMNPEQRKEAASRWGPLMKMRQALLTPALPPRPGQPGSPAAAPDNSAAPDAFPFDAPPETPPPSPSSP